MLFTEFLTLVPYIKKVVLNAEESHMKMMPKERLPFLNIDKTKLFNYKEAGVLLLVYKKNNQAHLVFIERTNYGGVHSAQIAFPGGKKEDIDNNLLDTALRETFEEIGVSIKSIVTIKEMSKVYIPPSNFLVSPYLAFSNTPINFILQKDEVQSIIEISLDEILNDKNKHYSIMNTSYANNIEVPVFQFNKFKIWGATAMMLSQFKDILTESIKAKEF